MEAMQNSYNVPTILKLKAKDNPVLKKFEVKQIFINEEALLDKNGQPLNPNRKFKCAIDSYIADGGQGFTTLQQAEKLTYFKNNQPLKINEVLLDAIKKCTTAIQNQTQNIHLSN